MIVLGAALLGCLIGGMTASRRGGKRLDILQYAAGYGIAFTILGVVLTFVVHNALL